MELVLPILLIFFFRVFSCSNEPCHYAKSKEVYTTDTTSVIHKGLLRTTTNPIATNTHTHTQSATRCLTSRKSGKYVHTSFQEATTSHSTRSHCFSHGYGSGRVFAKRQCYKRIKRQARREFPYYYYVIMRMRKRGLQNNTVNLSYAGQH